MGVGALKRPKDGGGGRPLEEWIQGLQGCGQCVGAGQMDVQWKDKQGGLVVDHNTGAGGECG